MATLFNEKINSLVYYTIGTGVGAGAIINGNFVGDIGHPEMGHVRLKRHPDDLNFKGICPYHGDCLEGLVSGPTLEPRTGKKGQDVPLSRPHMGYHGILRSPRSRNSSPALMMRPAKIVFGEWRCQPKDS